MRKSRITGELGPTTNGVSSMAASCDAGSVGISFIPTRTVPAIGMSVSPAQQNPEGVVARRACRIARMFICAERNWKNASMF